MEISEEIMKTLKELDDGFEWEVINGSMRYQIKKNYNKILFGKDLKLAMAYIAIKEKKLEMVRKAFDANHKLWIDIFGDAAENVEILKVFGNNSILCKVHTEHDYDIIVRVESYVNWEYDSEGIPAWSIYAW